MRLEQGTIRALRALGGVRAPERDEADVDRGAERFAASVAAMKVRAPKPARRTRTLAALLAACSLAAGLAIYGTTYRSRETPDPASTEAVSAIEVDFFDGAASRRLDPDGREWFLTEAGGVASIRMINDARALLSAGSQAWCWSEPKPSFLHLEEGMVDVDVPPLRMGQTLTVHTPNASVIVHGTAFTVQVVGSSPPSTTVVVRDGIVEVKENGASTFVHAGEVWRSGAANTPAESAIAKPLIPRVRAEPPQSPTPSAAPTASVATPPIDDDASQSTLARENERFREANLARQRGDFETYDALLAKLLQESPKSPMRATALVERAFTLTRLGRAKDAAQVARQALSEGAPEHVREKLWAIALAGGTPSTPR